MSHEAETLFTQLRLAFGAKKPSLLQSHNPQSAEAERRKDLLERILDGTPCAERSIGASGKKVRLVSDRALGNFVVTLFRPEISRRGEVETFTTITLNGAGEIRSALISSPSEKSSHEVLPEDVGFLLLRAQLDRTLLLALAH